MKNLILDSNNLLHRTYWVAHAASLKEETTTNEAVAVSLFLNAFLNYVDLFGPDKIYAAWDKRIGHGQTNFRKELTNHTYKAGRDKSQIEDIHQYDTRIEEILSSLGVKNIFPNVLEADDVISWICNQEGDHTVVSVDGDLLQLVSPSVTVYNPIKKLNVTLKNFSAITTVEKKYFLTYKALLGDKSDNIGGLYLVGPVKGAKLARQIVDKGNTVGILTDEQYEIYKRNVSLMDLQEGFKYNDEYTHYEKQLVDKFPQRDYKRFLGICEELHLERVISNKNRWYNKFFAENRLTSLIESLK